MPPTKAQLKKIKDFEVIMAAVFDQDYVNQNPNEHILPYRTHTDAEIKAMYNDPALAKLRQKAAAVQKITDFYTDVSQGIGYENVQHHRLSRILAYALDLKVLDYPAGSPEADALQVQNQKLLNALDKDNKVLKNFLIEVKNELMATDFMPVVKGTPEEVMDFMLAHPRACMMAYSYNDLKPLLVQHLGDEFTKEERDALDARIPHELNNVSVVKTTPEFILSDYYPVLESNGYSKNLYNITGTLVFAEENYRDERKSKFPQPNTRQENFLRTVNVELKSKQKACLSYQALYAEKTLGDMLGANPARIMTWISEGKFINSDGQPYPKNTYPVDLLDDLYAGKNISIKIPGSSRGAAEEELTIGYDNASQSPVLTSPRGLEQNVEEKFRLALNSLKEARETEIALPEYKALVAAAEKTAASLTGKESMSGLYRKLRPLADQAEAFVSYAFNGTSLTNTYKAVMAALQIRTAVNCLAKGEVIIFDPKTSLAETAHAEFSNVASSTEATGSMKKDAEEQVKAVLGDDLTEIANGFKAINVTPNEALYSLTVAAKMHILDSQKVPYTLDSLMDLKHNTAALNNQIRDLMKDYLKVPELPRGVNETDEDFKARGEEMRLHRFNTDFAKPDCQKLIGMLQSIYIRSERLPQQEKLKRLFPYSELITELDNVTAQLVSHPDGFTKQKISADLGVIKVIDTPLRLQREASSILDTQRKGEISRDLEFKQIANRAVRNYFNTGVRVKWDELAAKPDNEKADILDNVRNNGGQIFTDRMEEAFKKNGLFSEISDAQLHALATDPVLGEMLHFRTYAATAPENLRGKQTLFLGNIDLQTELPSDQVNRSKQDALLKIINQAVERNRIMRDMNQDSISPAGLRKTNTALCKAEKMLSDVTSKFNSSTNFRNMQSALKELRKFSETMAENGRSMNFLELIRLDAYTAEARDAARTYLEGKNALNGKAYFKNDYEESRVIAAKHLLRMLDARSTAVHEIYNKNAYRRTFNKMTTILKDCFPNKDLSGCTFEKYYTPERLALHQKARDIMKCEAEMTNRIDVPQIARTVAAGYFSMDTTAAADEHNQQMLKMLNTNTPESRKNAQEFFINSMNRCQQLDKDRLNPGKSSVEAISEYAMSNYSDLKFGERMGYCFQSLEEFGMTISPDKEDQVKNIKLRAEIYGSAGENAIRHMASDINFMVPIDVLSPEECKTLNAFLQKDNKFREYGISQENYSQLVKVISYSHNAEDFKVLDQQAIQPADKDCFVQVGPAVEKADNKAPEGMKEDAKENAGEVPDLDTELAGRPQGLYGSILAAAKKARQSIAGAKAPYPNLKRDIALQLLAEQVIREQHGQPALKNGDQTTLERIAAQKDHKQAISQELNHIENADGIKNILNKLNPEDVKGGKPIYSGTASSILRGFTMHTSESTRNLYTAGVQSQKNEVKEEDKKVVMAK